MGVCMVNVYCVWDTRRARKVVSLRGHVFVQYYPYGDTFSLWGQNPSPHKWKMLWITCLAYPVQLTSLGACLHRVCSVVSCGDICTHRQCIEWVTSPQGLHTYTHLVPIKIRMSVWWACMGSARMLFVLHENKQGVTNLSLSKHEFYSKSFENAGENAWKIVLFITFIMLHAINFSCEDIQAWLTTMRVVSIGIA